MLFLLVFEDLSHGIVLATCQSSVNHGHQMFGDGRDADLFNKFTKEAAHHKLAGIGFGNAAGFEVEQLLVIEASHRRGMAGTDDVAVLDFEVRLGIGDGTRGQNLRLSSYESVPGAVGWMSALPTQVECAPLPSSAPL